MPESNVEEPEVEQFYEDLQDLLDIQVTENQNIIKIYILFS